MSQVARRSASVLKRRKSRNRMEVSSERNNTNNNNNDGPNQSQSVDETHKDGDNEVLQYYMEEPQAPGGF
jgi:hypothetical protein